MSPGTSRVARATTWFTRDIQRPQEDDAMVRLAALTRGQQKRYEELRATHTVTEALNIVTAARGASR